jgi:hypothetical protein
VLQAVSFDGVLQRAFLGLNADVVNADVSLGAGANSGDASMLAGSGG